jgi:TM2 domain-containing membrane protein YozV
MNTRSTALDAVTLNAENKIAALLSIVPGLGQMYKGHFAAGFFWLIIGMPLAVWVGILLTLATAGLSMLLPVLCWVGIAVDAYCEKDIRRHHWLPGAAGDGNDESFRD